MIALWDWLVDAVMLLVWHGSSVPADDDFVGRYRASEGDVL